VRRMHRCIHSGRGWFRTAVLTAALATVVGAATVPLAGTPAHATQISCRDLEVPVSVLGTPQTMFGRLCAPVGARTVQVLVPGGTYNSSYWDIGYTPETRSFRLAMNRAGFATLAVDRLGTGRSSKPLGPLVTASTQAGALHEVVRALRTGTLGPRFDKVIIGGHSIGSAMAIIEAGTFHDVDGVLVTGMTHKMNWLTVAPVLANMVPAELDPLLAARGLNPGYLTTRAGTRFSAFHAPGPDIPEAIGFDESTKDVFAVTEAVDTSVLSTEILPYSRLIDVPVMIVTGDDTHFCGPPLGSDCASAEALRTAEAPHFSAEARLHTFVLHGYGHSINYAPHAPFYHRAVADWATTTVGR
jgi:pimeloyl-ACP methyl ester carboxylesterase